MSKYKNNGNVREEVLKITAGNGVDVVIDCVGAENTIYDSIRLLNKRGILVVVGLFGTNIKIPLVPSVTNEYSIYGSLWGNYNELSEVIFEKENWWIVLSKYEWKDSTDIADFTKV